MMGQPEEAVMCQHMAWPSMRTLKMKMLIATVILMGAWQLGLTRHVVVVASEQLTMVVIAVAKILFLATTELHARHGQRA